MTVQMLYLDGAKCVGMSPRSFLYLLLEPPLSPFWLLLQVLDIADNH